jgi:hypothetical protein
VLYVGALQKQNTSSPSDDGFTGAYHLGSSKGNELGPVARANVAASVGADASCCQCLYLGGGASCFEDNADLGAICGGDPYAPPLSVTCQACVVSNITSTDPSYCAVHSCGCLPALNASIIITHNTHELPV